MKTIVDCQLPLADFGAAAEHVIQIGK